MKKHNLLLFLTLIALLGASGTPVVAAKYSAKEAKKVRNFQKKYRRLSKKNYNRNSLFAVKPNFGIPFSTGILNPDYIDTSMAYVNYYRSLVGLTRTMPMTTRTHNWVRRL